MRNKTEGKSLDTMTEPKLNERVKGAIASLLERWPSPITHGEFNRRMFLESFVASAGMGVSIAPEDIQEYAAITDKEYTTILHEYVSEGIIVREDNIFGAELYKLNLTVD